MFTDIQSFRVNQVLGYQTMNRLRDDVFTLAAARFQHFLGGSRSVSLAKVIGPQDVPNWVDVELDSTLLTGMSVVLRVECRVVGAVSVTPKLRNLTDAIDIVVGSPCNATDTAYLGVQQKQTLPFVLSPGVKTYRLMGTPSAAALDTFVLGYLEIYYPSTTISIGSTPYTFASEVVAPPLNMTVRFNAAHPYTAVTKVWASSVSLTGVNVHALMMTIGPGASMYLEDKTDHLQWVRFETLGDPVDFGTYVEVPVKWVANGTALVAGEEVTFFAPSSGGLPLPHHATHETGGTDPITVLDAAVLQSGTLPDNRLSPNVALVTLENHFTAAQYLDGQSLTFNDLTVGKGSMRVHHAGDHLNIESLNDTGGLLSTPLKVQFDGNVVVNKTLLAAAATITGAVTAATVTASGAVVCGSLSVAGVAGAGMGTAAISSAGATISVGAVSMVRVTATGSASISTITLTPAPVNGRLLYLVNGGPSAFYIATGGNIATGSANIAVGTCVPMIFDNAKWHLYL